MLWHLMGQRTGLSCKNLHIPIVDIADMEEMYLPLREQRFTL